MLGCTTVRTVRRESSRGCMTRTAALRPRGSLRWNPEHLCKAAFGSFLVRIYETECMVFPFLLSTARAAGRTFRPSTTLREILRTGGNRLTLRTATAAVLHA